MGRRNKKDYRNLLLATTIPIVLVVSPLIGYTLGRFFDSFFSTYPKGSVFMLFMGFLAGFKEVYNIVKRIYYDYKKEDDL